MRKNLLRGLAVIGAVAAVTISMAASAFAGPPFTVTVAGSTSGSYAFLGTSTAPINFTAGVSMSCSSVVVGSNDATKDHIDAGTHSTSPYTIGSFQDSSWGGCTGPLGICMQVTQNGTWNINAISGPDASGVTTGSIANVSAHVQDCSGGSTCRFDVNGSVQGTFTNGTQVLAVTGPSSLTVSNISGCFGLVTPTASFTGNFHVTDAAATPAVYPVVIS